jgi:hypothetical protein
MKKSLITFGLLLSFIIVFAQNDSSFVMDNHQELLDMQKVGMVTLGSWAATNFAVSGYLMTKSSGTSYYFHQMNVFWNTVNMALAVSGYLGAENAVLLNSSSSVLMEYNKLSKILLVNAGLDVAYMAAGLYLRERSRNVSKHALRLKGYGNSVILQGGFLLVFDAVLATITELKLQDFLQSEQISWALSPGSFQLSFYF